MKIKYIIVILITFIVGISFVNAKSIEYNLTIDKDSHFYENNIYKIKKSEMDTSGNYDFMTSVVNDTIYFDADNSVKYTKTKRLNNGEYTIHLKNDYSSIFLTSSRVLNECFSKYSFKDDGEKLFLKLYSPFYCLQRADTITINIKTDLNVISANADQKNGNTYTWNPTSDAFELTFSAQTSPIEVADEVLDEDGTNDNTKQKENTEDKEKKQEENSKASSIIIIAIISSVIVLILIIAVILKSKRSNLDKI